MDAVEPPPYNKDERFEVDGRGLAMRVMFLILCLSLPGLALGQSLGEVAKKEKQRREQNRRNGKEAPTITEAELATPSEGRLETNVAGESSDVGSSRERISEGRYTDNAGSDERDPTTAVIPADASLEDRLQLFNLLKRGYQERVAEIDKEIAENNQRLSEIDRELTLDGSGGLPVSGDTQKLYAGNQGPALQSERQNLQNQNQLLNESKTRLKSDLLDKGRRAGIPPGYLRF